MQEGVKLVFNYKKYESYRIEKDKLSLEALELMNRFNDYRKFEGIDMETLTQQGHIILDCWCDEK